MGDVLRRRDGGDVGRSGNSGGKGGPVNDAQVGNPVGAAFEVGDRVSPPSDPSSLSTLRDGCPQRVERVEYVRREPADATAAHLHAPAVVFCLAHDSCYTM